MVFMFAKIGNIKIHVVRDKTITRTEFIVPPSLSTLELSLMAQLLKDIFWCNHFFLRLKLNVIPREGDYPLQCRDLKTGLLSAGYYTVKNSL